MALGSCVQIASRNPPNNDPFGFYPMFAQYNDRYFLHHEREE